MTKSKYIPNNSLQNLRKSKNLSAQEFGRRLGYSRIYISRVECGMSEGKRAFWEDVQTYFNLSDEDMWKVVTGRF